MWSTDHWERTHCWVIGTILKCLWLLFSLWWIQGFVLKESEKCNWKEVQLCPVSHSCVGNSTVLPLLKGLQFLWWEDLKRVRNHAAKEGKSNYFLLFTFPSWVTHKVLALSWANPVRMGLEVLGYRKKPTFRRGGKLYFQRDAKLVSLPESQRKQGQTLDL